MPPEAMKATALARAAWSAVGSSPRMAASGTIMLCSRRSSVCRSGRRGVWSKSVTTCATPLNSPAQRRRIQWMSRCYPLTRLRQLTKGASQVL